MNGWTDPLCPRASLTQHPPVSPNLHGPLPLASLPPHHLPHSCIPALTHPPNSSLLPRSEWPHRHPGFQPPGSCESQRHISSWGLSPGPLRVSSFWTDSPNECFFNSQTLPTFNSFASSNTVSSLVWGTKLVHLIVFLDLSPPLSLWVSQHLPPEVTLPPHTTEQLSE